MNQLSYRAADTSPIAAFDWIMTCLLLQGIAELLLLQCLLMFQLSLVL